MWRFLSLEYWKARFCGMPKPRSFEVRIKHECPHCQKQIIAFWGSEFESVESYVCRYCDKTYFAACVFRVEIWRGD